MQSKIPWQLLINSEKYLVIEQNFEPWKLPQMFKKNQSINQSMYIDLWKLTYVLAWWKTGTVERAISLPCQTTMVRVIQVITKESIQWINAYSIIGPD